jgi:hypothetical protein
MKKILLIAAFAVSGLTMVSCEADAIDAKSHQIEDVHADAIDEIGTTVGNGNEAEGPGDDVIIISPPKKR